MANTDPWESGVQLAAAQRDPWESAPPRSPTAKPPSTFEALAPGLGPLTLGGPFAPALHAVKRVLPQDWQDYITGVQRAAFQGATMNFGDEALAGVGAATGQGSYDDLLARERAANKGFREENPVGSTIGELHGALTSSAAIPMGPLGRTFIQGAAKGAPLIEKGVRIGARLLERALKGAGAGAAFGYGSGFGEGEGDLDTRNAAGVEGAKTGSMVGAVLNAGVPAVAAGAGKLMDAGQGAMRALAGPQTAGAQRNAAGEVIERLSTGDSPTPRTGQDLLADLATGQSSAPQGTGVPIPTANIMADPNLQAATRHMVARDSATGVELREGRETGAANTLDPMRPDGAPIAARTAIEEQDAVRRAALDAAEAEKQAAIREAQDAARSQQFDAREGVRETVADSRAAGRGAVEDARTAGAQRLRELEASLDERMQALRAQGLSEVDAAHSAATDALMATGAFPDKAAASRAARQAIEEELASVKRTGKGLYREVPEGTRLNVEPIYDSLAAVHREAYDSGRTTQIPDLVRSNTILDLFRNPTPQRLQGMKSMLYEEAAKLDRAGERTSAKWSRDVARSIDEALAGGGADSGVPELRAAANYWRENVVPFRQGVIGDILKTGSDGLPRIEPTRTLGAVVKPTSKGGTEAIDQFVQAAGGRENALTAATDWAIADAAEYAIGRNGRVDLARLNQWMRQRAPVLDALPGLRERLGNAQELAGRAEAQAGTHSAAVERAQSDGQEAVRQARASVQAQIEAARSQGADATRDVITRGREVMRQVEQRARDQVRAAQDAQSANVDAARRSVDEIQKSAAKLYLGVDPMKAAQGIMNSADPARAYLQVAERLRGNHEAMAGLKRSVFDALEAEMSDFATKDTAFRQGTRDLIGRNQPLLKAIFGEDNAGRVGDLLRALEMSKAHVNVPGNVGSATKSKGTQEDIAEALIQRAGGLVSRLPVVHTLLSVLRGNAQDAVRALVREALFDPEKMRVLLETRVTQQNAPSIAKRLSDWTAQNTMRATPAVSERRGHATGGRVGFDLGGPPIDPLTAADRFGAIVRGLRAIDTSMGAPYGPAPSLLPSSPYPVYYLPPGHGSGASATSGASAGVAAPVDTAAGGMAPPVYDAPGGSQPGVTDNGMGQGQVGPTGAGLSVDAAAQHNVNVDNMNNPTSQRAAQIGRTVVGLLAPTPIAAIMSLITAAARAGQSQTAPSPQVTKDVDPIGNPTVGTGQVGVGTTSGVTANPANNNANPGEVASVAPGPPGTTGEGGGGQGPSDSGTDASGNPMAGGGMVRRARRDEGGRTDDLSDRLRALLWRYGAGRNMAPFGQRLGTTPASANVTDLRRFGPQEDWSALPPTQDEVAATLWQLNGEQERSRMGVAGPMYAPETDDMSALGALLNRGW